MSTKCPICKSPTSEDQYPNGADKYRITCLRCGKYSITRSATINVEHKLGGNEDLIAMLSSWIRENPGVEFDSRSWDRVLPGLRIPSFGERVDKLLKYIANLQIRPGKTLKLTPIHQAHTVLKKIEIGEVLTNAESDCANDYFPMLAISWSRDFGELEFFLSNYLRDELGYISRTDDSSSSHFDITPQGWTYLEELRSPNIDSPTGFVAMWFDEETEKAWEEAIKPAIEEAGYDPVRIDKEDFLGMVDDEIQARMRQSRFIVADHTGHRGGVIFETGFAIGLGLPVIFLCREDDFNDTHFDVSHYPFLLWKPDDLESIRDRLKYRIMKILGQGPNIKE